MQRNLYIIPKVHENRLDNPRRTLDAKEKNELMFMAFQTEDNFTMNGPKKLNEKLTNKQAIKKREPRQ
jgi:hypothetical protein